MKIKALVIVLVCPLIIGGCVFQKDLTALNERIIMLEERNRELEQLNTSSKKELKNRIEDYTRTREEKERKLRNQSAGMQAMFDGVREDIQELRGKVEETDYLLQRKIKMLEDSEKGKERELRKLKQKLNSIESKVEVSKSWTSAPLDTKNKSFTSISTKPAKKIPSEDELYTQAKQAYDKKKYQAAREGFKQLLGNYPKSRHADNAQFWLGEIYYQEKWYEKAILEYQTVIEKYPDGNKVKAALLKQGFAFFSLGDKANARLILEELVQRYPDSHEAKIAKDKLDWF